MNLARATKVFLAAAALSVVPAVAASAAALSFSAASDYDNHFFETSLGADVGWSATGGGRITKGPNVNSAPTVVYNTTATGGVAGSGGTGVATPNNNTFINPTLTIDFNTPLLSAGGNGAGFFSKINAAGSSGYTAILRLTSATTADFRVWDTDSNPATGALGTQIGVTQTITAPAGSFAANTFYTLKLDVTDVGSNVQLTGSVFAVGGAQLGNSVSITDTTSAVLGAGQVGLRFGSENATANLFDNFTVNSVPEPGAAALLGVGMLGALVRRGRRGSR